MLRIEYEFPEDVTAKFEDNNLTVSGPKGTVKREMIFPRINVKLEDKKLEITSDKEVKKTKAVMYTWKALTKGMSLGVTKGWKVSLKLVYSHFPVKLKHEGNRLTVENFLGERQKREVKIPDDVKLEVKGNDLVLTGIDKEKVGQVAALIEQKVTVKKFDRRVFQDGIYKIGKTENECD